MENTIPLEVFQAQYPARFSLLDDDKFVLHAGSSRFQIALTETSRNQTVVDPALDFSGTVSLFVLNTCFVVWLNESSLGVEFPYTLIALHALQEVNGQVVLYLQLLSCALFHSITESLEFESTVELVLGETSQNTIEMPLLTHNSSILQIYDALGRCSALHFDSESDSEVGEPDLAPEEPEIPAQWLNLGDADDLGMDTNGSDGEAGMNVGLGTNQIAGTIRRRDLKSDEHAKIRKLQ